VSRAGTLAEPPGRLRKVVWWVTDWFWTLRAHWWALQRPSADAFRDGDLAPVIAVPGVYESWHFLLPEIRALHDAGHPVFVVDGLGYNLRPVEDGARLLADRVAALDLHDVVVLAHSKGGLIGKLAMSALDPGGRIDRMIAIATPFGGSRLARYVPGRTLRAFRAVDPTLAGLARNLEVNGRITSVFGPFDTLIPDGSVLAGATNVPVAQGGHFLLLTSPEVVRAVVAAAA
jgi:pimeloyl-ACP methyl ester carboxylesterase